MEPKRPIGHHLVRQYIRVPEKEERKKRIFEEITSENFPNLMKDVIINI